MRRAQRRSEHGITLAQKKLTMSRHLRLIAVCAGLLASAGCSSERRLPTAPLPPGPAGPTEPAPPQTPSAPQRLAALALFDAVIVHERLTTSPLTYATQDGKVVRTNGPCVTFVNGQPDANGSLQGSLDGSLSPTSGTFLPTGCRLEQPYRDGFGRFGARFGCELFR